MASTTKTVVIGLDGATWNYIKPLVEKGKLPTFKKLMEGGTHGDLESTIPPTTGPAWTSAFTGVNPGKHNIFHHTVNAGYDSKPVNASYRRSRPIWQILSGVGLRVVVINVPITYPPDWDINGVMISGMDTPSMESAFTHPKELRDKLVSMGYVINEIPDRELHDEMCRKVSPKHLQMILNVEEKRMEILLHLMRNYDWDFFVGIIMAPDRMGHLFWRMTDDSFENGLNREEKWNETISINYEKIDAFLKELLKITAEKVNFVILSDHGFGQVNKHIFVNNWLKNLKLLKNKKHLRSKLLRKLKLTRGNLGKILDKFHLHVFKNLVPNKVVEKIPRWGAEIRDIDWTKTKAWLNPSIYELRINVKGREPQGVVEPGSKYEELRDRIILEARNLRDPVTKERVIKIFKREDIFYGSFVEDAPDMIVAPNDGYMLEYHMDEGPIVRLGSGGWHVPKGIFLAFGPDIERGKGIFNANIIDITPTILHMMGIPVPRYMDGQVLKDIFREGSALGEGEVIYSDLDERERVTLLEKGRITAKVTKLRRLGRI